MRKANKPTRGRPQVGRYDIEDVEMFARLHFMLDVATQTIFAHSGESSRTYLLEAATQALLEEIVENVPARIGIPLLDRIEDEVFGSNVCDECSTVEDKANHPGTLTPQ